MPLSRAAVIWSMLCCAMPWPIAGTLETMAVPRLAEAVFCCWRFWRTTLETPIWSKLGFLETRVSIKVVADEVRSVAVC